MPSTHPLPTLGTLRRQLVAKLERAFAATGREGTPALDARLLVAHALGVDAAGLALRDDDPVDAAAEARAQNFVERRIAGEPVARIIGRQEFWGLDFALGPDTLVPRPDTETVVEAALAFIDQGGLDDGLSADSALGSSPVYGGGGPPKAVEGATTNSESAAAPSTMLRMVPLPRCAGEEPGLSSARRNRELRLLDIGTGSGAILLALLSELPKAKGTGTDCATGALHVARDNALRLGLAARTEFVACDWAAGIGGKFDVVLANPPYVESRAIADLQVEVSAHEPHLALDGGPDGLDAYRAIFADLDRLLAKAGKAFLEVGRGQAADVAKMAEKHGFRAILYRDLAGIERVAEIGRI